MSAHFTSGAPAISTSAAIIGGILCAICLLALGMEIWNMLMTIIERRTQMSELHDVAQENRAYIEEIKPELLGNWLEDAIDGEVMATVENQQDQKRMEALRRQGSLKREETRALQVQNVGLK